MNNLELWNAVKQPPASALKQIIGGRLKGKTDIAPQWRYQEATNQFGPCGLGWKWVIKRVWNEPLPDGQILCFAEVDLFYKMNNTWSEAVPGIGGSMLVEEETRGLHASDEGYKMAVTDALSVAFKTLGFASDVYAGMWDGSKYRDAAITQPEQAPQLDTHFCKEHNTAYFMKGKMKSYAHPIGETGNWCYEHKTDTPQDARTATKPAQVVQSHRQEADAAFEKLESAQPEVAQMKRISDGFAVLGLVGDSEAVRVKKGKQVREWGLSFDNLDAIEAKINELVNLKGE